jgi:hypothetical protein
MNKENLKYLGGTVLTFAGIAFVFSILSNFMFPWTLLPASILTSALILRVK